MRYYTKAIINESNVCSIDKYILLGGIDLTVDSIVQMLESNQRTVPEWLPMLLGAKAAVDGLPKLALQCFLLPINGETSRIQTFNVLVEAIRVLQQNRAEENQQQWLEIGMSAINGLSEFDRKHPVTLTMQGVLCFHGGDHVRGCAILAKVLKTRAFGLWRSAASFLLAKFYKEKNNSKKSVALFESFDQRDPLYSYSKKLFQI